MTSQIYLLIFQLLHFGFINYFGPHQIDQLYYFAPSRLECDVITRFTTQQWRSICLYNVVPKNTKFKLLILYIRDNQAYFALELHTTKFKFNRTTRKVSVDLCEINVFILSFVENFFRDHPSESIICIFVGSFILFGEVSSFITP